MNIQNINITKLKYRFPSDWHEIFITGCIVFAISLFLNPLNGIEISVWDRTFSPALLDGISIGKRIANFYILFLFALPILFFGISIVIRTFLRSFPQKKDELFVISCFMLLLTLSAYFNHTPKDVLVISILFVLANFVVVSLYDKDNFADFSFFTKSLLLLLTLTVSINIFSNFRHIYPAFGISCVFLIGYEFCCFICYRKKKALPVINTIPYVLMWIPTISFISLEVIYFLIEKGWLIQNNRPFVVGCCLLYTIVAEIVLITKKANNEKQFGYIGAIASFVCIAYFQGKYHFVFDYGNYPYIYELGNLTVAADTFFRGKLPIIDYFSAHALGDVWTGLIYAFIHNDFKGILVNPYYGLIGIVAFFALFYIIRAVFSDTHNIQNKELDFAILYILLFPALVTGIKWISVCIVVIAALIHLQKNNTFKSNYIFWISVLISSLHTYDEGISLSLGCIIAVLITAVITKSWGNLKRFVSSGVISVFILSGILIIYCLATDLDPISRFKEWLSVSVGSSSSWATTSFGDESSFAFFIAYFLVPIIVISVITITVINFCKTKYNQLLFALIFAFSITELFYIPRTIVYHNLKVCGGITGVLMNYIHWTLALFALYFCSRKLSSLRMKSLVFIFVMFTTITLEGAFVTNYLPNSKASLAGKAIENSKEWRISNHNKDNIRASRIVYEKKTQELVGSFKTVFDTLLNDKQTFLDFANVTSMYLLTGRERPAYVGQMPSLLTDLYSQEQFLKEIEEYDCPIAVLGTTAQFGLQQMIGIPHNIRYYKIAEYIYRNYRPLVKFDEIAVWCKKDVYSQYANIIKTSPAFSSKRFSLIDYGYDFTSYSNEENKSEYKPFHSFNLKMLPYIWANNDKYNAVSLQKLSDLRNHSEDKQQYRFSGSKHIDKNNGNYLLMKLKAETNTMTSVKIYDSNNKGASYTYDFSIKKGENNYLIRISQDYFWHAFNVDTVEISNSPEVNISNIQLLIGD